MLAGWQYAADWHRQSFPRIHRETHINVHIGSQFQIRVLNVDPHPAGPRDFIDERIDHRNVCLELLARIRRGAEHNRQPLLQHRQLVLVKLCPHPNHRQVGNIHQMISQHHPAALVHAQALHGPFEGRIKRQQFLGLARFFQFRDLLLADVPQSEPLSRRFHQTVGALLHGFIAPGARFLPPLQEVHKFFLRRQQIRTVDRQKGRILLDRLAP